jgi:diguanylate cyclase (GGDEF)-like protein/PAS domain S-box-containing protein
MSSSAKISQQLLCYAVNESKDGIAIVDARTAGFPLIFVSKGFENMTGYMSAEVTGKNFRLFHANDTNQSGLALIRSAFTEGIPCVATLRNYRKDGSMYWNELSVTPVHDDGGMLTHFISIHKDVTAKILLEQQLKTLTNTDPVAGIGNRRHFEERFSNLLSIAKRIKSEMSVLLINLDYLTQFNEQYGQSAGDECLHKVGNCIAQSFRRTSDCAARYSGEEFSVVSFSSNLEGLHLHLQQLCERVRQFNIPHSGSPHGIVTISIGGVQRMPDRDTTEAELIEQAKLKLLAAKNSGCNGVNFLD